MSKAVSLCILALWLSACLAQSVQGKPTLPEAPRDPYVAALIERALASGVAKQPQWLRLLHAHKPLFGGGFIGDDYESEADGAGFFLSPRGKLDPRAELAATLAAMFEPAANYAHRAASPERPNEQDGDLHPICRFPARAMFLQRALGIDPARLPAVQCPLLSDFLSELGARSVTLVFSSYYLNNPASAFGHTFLRFNKYDPMATSARRELLDYGIDYSANVDTGNAAIYAIKGLTGMFQGTFKRVPFFYKVREYNDYESRDLWEYELNLQPEQLLLLTLHLWELGHTHFDYYYLSENCSYHILSLIEVADPSRQLLQNLRSPIIPADTVKALYDNPGLVHDVRFRPSLRKQFAARAAGLSSSERELVEDLASDAETALPAALSDERRIAVFDAAADLVDVLYARELVHRENSAAARRKQRILERRAAIMRPSQPLQLQVDLEDAPQHGHGSGRLGLGAARTPLGGDFGPMLDFRLALHDLADSPPGYLELSAIEFLRVRAVLFAHHAPQLQDASFVRVDSLTPQSRFDRKMSWQFDVGATTIADRGCNHCLAAQVAGGSGAAFSLFDQALTIYGMAHGAVLWSPPLSGLEHSHVRLGIGPSGGLRVRLHRRLIALFNGRWLWLPAQAPKQTYRVDGTLRFQYLHDLALGVEARLTPEGVQAQALSFLYF